MRDSRNRPPKGLDLDALRWMLAATATGSLSAVARQESISQSTVSRAISRLECLDAIVRAGRPTDSELRRTYLGDYGHCVVAAPSYTRRHDAPTTPADLDQHSTIAVRLELCGRLGCSLKSGGDRASGFDLRSR